MENIILTAKEAVKAFGFTSFTVPQKYGTGHINYTFLFNSEGKDYILQRINNNVFKSPESIMKNIAGVTSFLREKIVENGGNPERECLHFLNAEDGRNFYIASDGSYWRVMPFIENSIGYDMAESLEMFRKCGYAFGNFQKMLSDYPADELSEVIPDFHNTPERVNQLKEAIENNLSGRADTAKAEIEFALSREGDAAELVNMLKAGKIPLRVTHNDTKMSNILCDKDSDLPICVIDLDTVMPGLAAYDFGDSNRAGSSTAAEDEADLSKVNFDLDLYRAYAEGFLEACASEMSDDELYSLSVGAKLMTYECGTRFLADYINGDTYFRTAYPEHNLVRARNQFRLVTCMEDNMEKMHSIVKECADRR
ncbi:MAG: aminoglycoside phosphotransferase family protein [Clostridia bacterium]|nr:aminoglycoside phosphotransferase family protein [Clostridia bacterium]